MRFFLHRLCEKNHETKTNTVHNVAGAVRVLTLVLASSLVLCMTLAAQGNPELSIPAAFKFDLTLPGDGNHFLRPARIFTDHTFHEVYVCDPGNARILIFNEQGIFQFEFSVSEYMGAPLDVAVSSDGYVLVLGSTREGMRLFKFDFDGLYLGPFASDPSSAQAIAGASSLAIDEQDRVYTLIPSRGTIVRAGIDGTLQTEFPIDSELDREAKDEVVYGSMHFADGYLYVPISSGGTVKRFTSDGKTVGEIGIPGTLVGQLNFPVSVSVSPDGIIMILDKHRFNVVCYDQQGRFLAEFGGKGINDGWFYHPSWLAIDSRNQVYVGQIFQNKIQVISIPELVYKRQLELTGQPAHSSINNSKAKTVCDNAVEARRWTRKEVTGTFDCAGDDILRFAKTTEITIPNNLLQLAFNESVGGIYNA